MKQKVEVKLGVGSRAFWDDVDSVNIVHNNVLSLHWTDSNGFVIRNVCYKEWVSFDAEEDTDV